MSINTDPFAPSTASRNAFGKDKPMGSLVTGTITEVTEQQQRNFDTDLPEFWEDGKPKMQAIVRIQTTQRDDDDDDGIRTCYAKGGHKTPAASGARGMKEAIVAAGQTAKQPIRVGGKLTIKYVEDGEPSKRGYNGPKLYVAKYEPPTAADPFGTAADDLI